MDARESECAKLQAETGAAFVHPYNDPKVMAGEHTGTRKDHTGPLGRGLFNYGILALGVPEPACVIVWTGSSSNSTFLLYL